MVYGLGTKNSYLLKDNGFPHPRNQVCCVLLRTGPGISTKLEMFTGVLPMLSPFPGMDLYLEQPAVWASFHSKLIVALADAIETQLDTAYYVEVETRSYLDDDGSSLLVGIPDVSVAISASDRPTEPQTTSAVATAPLVQKVMLPIPQEIKERYLEIRDVTSGVLITAIELLSPKNKRAGEGRKQYESKRSMILSSLTHFVEIDLLRGGQPMPLNNIQARSDYQILVSRSHQRPQADLYGFSIRDTLPTIPIPLANQKELSIDLQAVFNGVYQRSRYRSRIDYQQPVPPPKLAAADEQWVQQLRSSSPA
jgi:hypothetical protein